MKKLVKTVFNNVEKKIDDVIKDVNITLKHFLDQGIVSESDSFDWLRLTETDSDFSSVKGEGLKMLTPNQMLSRLPFSVAQLNAGNNSKNSKEIRQLLHSLYRSKKLTKNIYKSMVDVI